MRIHSSDVIVIGGGVAGLAAAGELTRRQLRVTLLEAKERLGGRVFTVRPRGWPGPIELGAQFVHGGNEALRRILRRHSIVPKRVVDRHSYLTPEGLKEVNAADRLARVTKRIDPSRMKGWSFADFLRREGQGLDDIDRNLAIGFVEGFEAAPCDEMSAVAVAGETLEDSEQFTLPVGYDRVVAALESEIEPKLAAIFLNAACSSVVWRRGAAEVSAGRRTFSAPTVIVTVPLGVLRAGARERGALRFSPRLRAHEAVLTTMRMGHVIRVTLRFDQRRWRVLLPPALKPDGQEGFGFVHSRLTNAPVWWSLSGDAVVTGWAGGPNAQTLSSRPEMVIREAVLGDLGRVLGVKKTELKPALRDAVTHNWSRDPFSRGAYSYTPAGHEDDSERLREPVRQTIFFAGEATADGEERGTVHGALASGLRAAAEVGEALGA